MRASIAAKTLFRTLCLALLLGSVVATASVAAQITTGSITGVIRDEAGGVVPGVSVTLVNEALGTKSSPAITDANGEFVFPNVTPGTYTLEALLSGFKAVHRVGISVSPSDRAVVPALVLEVGAMDEVVNVTAAMTTVQSQSGERSHVVTSTSVESLPLSNRSFTSLAALAPGMSDTGRLGGGGPTNVTLDGAGIMGTGSNSPSLLLNVEAIAEVKILVSGYQAEYGRLAGVQLSATTRSGTNRFHGAIYDIERNSDWNSNSWANERNGVAKPVLKERDWGYSLGGPVGRPGGNNRLFFFVSQEWRPRTAGGNERRFRVPTAAERAGDFSESRDNNGNLYNIILDAQSGLPCTSTNRAGCFQAGGVLGRIPSDRLYGIGLNVLNLYPMPNDTSGYAASGSYNYVDVSPTVKSHLRQELVRFDYQMLPSLRFAGKVVSQDASRRPNQSGQQFGQGNSLIVGFNDAVQDRPDQYQFTLTGNYVVNQSTFLEVNYGRFYSRTGTLTFSDKSNKNNVGLGDFPMLFPDANVIDPKFYSFERLSEAQPQWFADGRSYILPNFTWGNRIANPPPNMRDYGCCITSSRTREITASLTKVVARHTFKAGYYLQHSIKPQTAGVGGTGPYNGAVNFGNSTNNPEDSTFGFSNAALGIFTTYQQASRFLEGHYVYFNHEFYLQDNWKVNPRLTLDYGMRFIHQTPQYDTNGFASNFLESHWDPSRVPALYRPVCVNVQPCAGLNVRAQDPMTGNVLGPGSGAAVGQIVPNSGDLTNGVFLAGTGPVAKTNHVWPAMVYAPRIGYAYDFTGNQRVIARGSFGLFYTRPEGNSIFGQINNPPASTGVTMSNGRLQDLGSNLGSSAPPNMTIFQYESGIPASVQWNTGVQIALPWTSVLDVSYVGQHSYNQLSNADINAPDFGAAYLPANQNPTVNPSAVPGASALPVNFYRPFQGFGSITRNMAIGYNDYHSMQTSLSRRFINGISATINYTLGREKAIVGTARLQRSATGDIVLRDDQKRANYHLASTDRTHVLRGYFVWDPPDYSGTGALKRAVGLVINDWQLSGVVSASSGVPYSANFSYQGGIGAVNLTGTPNYNARIVINGDPGSGCSGDPTRQLNTAVFAGPAPGSDGLESGQNYLRGCVQHSIDVALSRNIRFGAGRAIQLRVEMFNAFNAVAYTGRNATMNIAGLATASTPINLPYDASGNLIPANALPRSAGFGVATASQPPRSVQAQIRVQF